VGLFFRNTRVYTAAENGVWLVGAKFDGALSCWICHTQDCHLLGPLQQTASQRYLSTWKQHCRFTVLLSLQHFCSVKDSRTLVTFYRCAVIFQVEESLTTLCTAYGLSKSSFNHKFWFPLYLLLHESWYTRSIVLDITNMTCATHYSLHVMTKVRSSWDNMPKHIPTCSKKVLLQRDIKVQQKWTQYGHFLSGHVL
jgi:hypothetical protein